MTIEEFSHAIEAAPLESETQAKADEDKKPKQSTASSSVINNSILAEAEAVARTSPLEHGEGWEGPAV